MSIAYLARYRDEITRNMEYTMAYTILTLPLITCFAAISWELDTIGLF